MPTLSPEEIEDIPAANMVRISAEGGNYEALVADVTWQLGSFFGDTGWKVIGARIEPKTWSESFEGTGNVLVWEGEFFAIALDGD